MDRPIRSDLQPVSSKTLSVSSIRSLHHFDLLRLRLETGDWLVRTGAAPIVVTMCDDGVHDSLSGTDTYMTQHNNNIYHIRTKRCQLICSFHHMVFISRSEQFNSVHVPQSLKITDFKIYFAHWQINERSLIRYRKSHYIKVINWSKHDLVLDVFLSLVTRFARSLIHSSL